MRVIKLPDGRLRIPLAAEGEDWAADGTETIGPEDPMYAEYLPLVLSEEEHEAHDRESESTNAQLLARWGARYEAHGGRRTA